mmetsp:Transcript_38897/g.90951  ORF Transcript_38897/g.90951 Transcript_38897/m.90951 type:complete len:221 (-) Transcript_38897:578-1240(-)
MRPPKPKVAPHGRCSHLGARAGRLLGGSDTANPLVAAGSTEGKSCREKTDTSPSNEHEASIAGMHGDHCTSKVQLLDAGISETTSPRDGSQQMVRLSFPAERSKLASSGHHEAVSTPLVWPRSSVTGASAFRKSQICSLGDASSSEATRICVATSGFHAMTLLRWPRLVVSVKLITGRFNFKSQTTESPECEVEARMWATLRFHATHAMSADWFGRAPGL